MPMRNDEIKSTLNNLIRTTKDSEEGFRTVAEDVRDPELKTLFRDCADQRRRFSEELKGEAHRLGLRPEAKGSVMGALHRGWIDLRSALQRGDEVAILSEAERGEDKIRDVYREELQKDLPSDVRSTVQREFEQINETHDRIRDMRDSAKERKRRDEAA